LKIFECPQIIASSGQVNNRIVKQLRALLSIKSTTSYSAFHYTNCPNTN